MGILRSLFGNEEKQNKKEFSDEEHEEYYELKSKGIELVLGKMHNLVGHAIISFPIGGAVDMYYYPNHIQGTGFATMQLLNLDDNNPKKNRFGTYELLAFTKYDYDLNTEEQTPFSQIERKACGFLTLIGRYSSEAVLNPKDTIEVPTGDNEENTCLIFDIYEPNGKKFLIGNEEHHLLLCIQIFRIEMEYARQNGGDELFKLLKENGAYPYSDLDREPVVKMGNSNLQVV